MKIEFENHELIELAVKQHGEFVDKVSNPKVMDFLYTEQRLEHTMLSLNFGRQFGHTTAIKNILKQEGFLMVVNNDIGPARELYREFGKSIYTHHKFLSTKSPDSIRGMRFDNCTIVIDRAYFRESNKNIIKILSEFFHPVQLSKFKRIIVLG